MIPHLQTRDMTLTRGKQSLFKNLNLTFHSGEVWGILGQNGSGKTTLLHALAGLHPLTQGEVLLRHAPLQTLSIKSIAQTIGLLFQETTTPFPLTVWEYCFAGRFPHQPYFSSYTQQDEHIVKDALNAMELDHLAKRNLMQLSGGEKRRLAIAALLAQTPDIYLLDEPTNHLDVRYQIRILERFKSLAKTKTATIVMTLHDVNLAQQFCDRILLLHPNGKTQQGPTATLLTETYLEEIYQCPMVAIPHNDITYWMPKIS